jgi:hypothetical protein
LLPAGKQEQHRARVLDRVDDFLVIARSHRDVARRHPAGDVAIFEIRDQRERGLGVFRGMADE